MALAFEAFVLSAPFQSGIVFDLEALLATDQPRGVWLPDGKVIGQGWRLTNRATRPSGAQFDVDNFGGSPLVPHVMAKLALAPGDVLLSPLEGMLEGWLLREAEVLLNPFGFGALRLILSPDPAASHRIESVRPAEVLSSTLLVPAGQLVRTTLDLAATQLRGCVEAHEAADMGQAAHARGMLLWAHRIFVLRGDPDTADGLIEAFADSLPVPPLPLGHGPAEARLHPGLGTSFALLGPEAPASCWQDLANVIDMANLAWSTAAFLGDTIVRTLHQIDEARRGGRVAELRLQASALLDLYDRLIRLRALHSDQIRNLPPRDCRLFDLVSDAWRLPQLLSELDDRRQDLESLHSQTLAVLDSRQARRTGRVLAALTVLSALSVTAAAVEFTFGTPLSRIDIPRLLLLGAGTLLLLSLALLASLEPPRRLSLRRRRASRTR